MLMVLCSKKIQIIAMRNNDKHCHIITGCEDKELIYTNIL